MKRRLVISFAAAMLLALPLWSACELVEPSEQTPTPTPTPTPSPTPTPGSKPPTPTPEPTLRPTPTPLPTLEPTPGPTLDSGVSVRLAPGEQSARPGEEISLSIEVTPGEYGVSSGEINLSFPVKAMRGLDMVPGDLFGADPLTGTKVIDNQGGTVRYALARVGRTTAPTPEGVFATIEFEVLTSAASQVYEVALTGVGLADEAFESIEEIELQHASVDVR